jgi:alkanesulfonate monooxygenase
MYLHNGSTQAQVEVFSTCPQSSGASPDIYRQHVIDVARWSEQCGCKGILVYSDNSLVDPWLTAQIIIENTDRLCPLVAVQPIYTHPYTVAKTVATFGFLFKRRVYLNMVAGGFKNDLTALNDTTAHDKRYARLVEYTTIIQRLLASPGLVNYDGEFYRVENLRMTPPLDPELLPGVFVSGSSEAGLEAAQVLGATAIKYPKPPKECETEIRADDLKCGVRVGIIARESEEVAWVVAEQRFPEDRKGQLTHQLAMKVSDSMWHKQLTDMANQTRGQRHPYWLRPFENYKTFCPYLVGDYDRVAEEIGRYIGFGYRTFILDVPPNYEELQHVGIVFERADKIAVT